MAQRAAIAAWVARTLTEQQLPDYLVKMRDATDEDLLNDWSAQIHRNAEIANEKMRCVKWGMAFALLAVPFWFAAVLSLLNKNSA